MPTAAPSAPSASPAGPGWVPALELSWLGRPAIRRDGQPASLATRKALALLAYLSLAPGPQPREALAALFWPEHDSPHALGNLRRALGALRDCLGAAWLEATNETVALGHGPTVITDTDLFLRDLAAVEAHRHAPGEACDACVAALARAAGRARGDFLAGLTLPDCREFDEWQFLQREEFRRRLAGALEALARTAASRGAWDEAQAHARRWVALDRLCEPAQRLLIALYAQAGLRGAARRQYDECVRLLRSELQQEPERATLALAEGLRPRALARGAPGPAPGARAQPLLQTKLTTPPLRAGTVERARLIAALDEATRAPLTLLSAPAGFGKTTLLVAWATQTPLRVAWMALDPTDNDPRRFLAYLLAAARGGGPAAGPAYVAPVESEAILTGLLNDLASRTEPLALVLDDYQFITNPAIHSMLAFLVEHLPAQLRLVLAGRADPPLPLPRLRARDQLREIRANSLRFTADEAAQFLNGTMGLDLGASDVARLAERTEGWIAGLQMAALSLQGQADRSGFVRAFSGSNHYILDYLLDEALAGQPPDVQAFLLQTAVLDRLHGPLCDALTGRTDGQAMLERLERANLFVTPLDETRQWYRYHHLFSDLLRARLQAAPDSDAPAQHRRACAWYAAHDLPSEAIAHAGAAGDYECAAELLERAGHALWNNSEINALDWVDTLPADVVRVRPWLCVHRAWKQVISGQTDAAARWLREAQEHIEAAGPPTAEREILAFAAAVEALIAGYTGEMSRAADRARAALAAVSADKIGMRNTLTYILAFAEYMEGDLTAAARDFLEATGNDRAHRSTNALAAAMSKLAQIQLVEGRLPEAARICRESLQLVAEQGAERFYVAGNLRLTLGSVLLEWGERDAARTEIERGIAENGKWTVANSDVYGQAVLARALLAAGDLDGARAAVQAGEQISRDRRVTGDVVSELAASRARLWLAAGDLNAAAQWAEAGGLGVEDPLSFRRELDHLTLARIRVAQGRTAEALRLLARLDAAALAAGRAGRRVEILTLQAVARARRGESSAAVAALGLALALAEPGGYAGAFLEGGAPLRALLAQGLDGECWPDTLRGYARKLLKLGAAGPASAPPLAEAPTAPQPRTQESRHIEPLTPREREVLRLMAGGSSYGEIAAALVVTAGTVKTHAHHIYGKLDRRTCVSAVARARELGLV